MRISQVNGLYLSVITMIVWGPYLAVACVDNKVHWVSLYTVASIWHLASDSPLGMREVGSPLHILHALQGPVSSLRVWIRVWQYTRVLL